MQLRKLIQENLNRRVWKVNCNLARRFLGNENQGFLPQRVNRSGYGFDRICRNEIGAHIRHPLVDLGTLYHRRLGTRSTQSPYLLGRMAETGQGLPQAGNVARYYYELATQQGSAEAADRLAALHDNGFGGPRDARAAARWRTEARKLRALPKRDPFMDPASWRRWEGHRPFDRLLGRRFLEIEGIAERVRSLIGEESYEAIFDYSTGEIISVTGDWVRVSGCLTPHCGVYWFTLFVEAVPSGQTALCWIAPRPIGLVRDEVLVATGHEARKRETEFFDGKILCNAGETNADGLLARLRTPPEETPLYESR